MQVLNCNVGGWKAQARIQEIEENKVMATIQILDKDNDESIASRHTVVFEHDTDCDAIEETKNLVQVLLGRRYG